MKRFWLLLLLVAGGCSGNPGAIDAPVSINGKVLSENKPVSDVAITLQPMENGYTKTVDLKPDGTFTVETQPGKYAYFFGPKTGAKSTPAKFNKLLEPNMSRTVQLTSGKDVEIVVD